MVSSELSLLRYNATLALNFTHERIFSGRRNLSISQFSRRLHCRILGFPSPHYTAKRAILPEITRFTVLFGLFHLVTYGVSASRNIVYRPCRATLYRKEFFTSSSYAGIFSSSKSSDGGVSLGFMLVRDVNRSSSSSSKCSAQQGIR